MKNSSTKPLGATSYKDTAFGIIPRSKLLQLEIEGTKKGLEYLYDLVKNNKDIRITPEFICKLHEVSFAWIFTKWAGKYRKIQVTFSDKEAPKYFEVPALIINLCNDLKERLKHLPPNEDEQFILEVVKLLAWFQHWFVFIHPFQDYNGRTARMLTIFILLQLDLPPLELKVEREEYRKEYLTAMQNADNGDYSLLERLIGEALSETLDLSQK
ncbi:MAG TPA: Fic family protein [Methylomirabilota bacterium]|nr:Fic family protein [Methylomirabilota bacterium]